MSNTTTQFLIKPKGLQRLQRNPSLGLVPEYIPAGRGDLKVTPSSRNALDGRGGRNDLRIGAEQCSPEQGLVGPGGVFSALGGGIGGGRDVEEGEVGAGSGGDEAVAVDGAGWGWVVVERDSVVGRGCCWSWRERVLGLFGWRRRDIRMERLGVE